MGHSPLPTIILGAILLISSLSITTKANSGWISCGKTEHASISYKNNVNLLFSDFISHSSLEGYYNTNTGDSPDRVYGYYMCRGDLKPRACHDCIVNATQFAKEVDCEYQDRTFFHAKCIFQYKNHSTYGEWEISTLITSHLGVNVSNYQQYNQTLMSTMEALINKAAFESNSSGSILGFATMEAQVTGDDKIYSLAQCTPDIVGVNCSRCLRSALSSIEKPYETYQGADIRTPNCLLKYNNESFYYLNKGEGLIPPNLLLIYSALFLVMYYSLLLD